jgi:hypothetical protein
MRAASVCVCVCVRARAICMRVHACEQYVCWHFLTNIHIDVIETVMSKQCPHSSTTCRVPHTVNKHLGQHGHANVLF